MEKVYTVRNLDCANCAGKIEAAINQLSEVDSAVLVFATKKLRIKGKNDENTLDLLNRTAKKIESAVEIVPEDEKIPEKSGLKKDIITLCVGVIFYAAALICDIFTDSVILNAILYGCSYLVLGAKIIVATVRNIPKGNIFDENFLMTVATVGAFALGEFSEAVGVVLFFTIGEIFEKYAVEKSRSAISAAADLKVNEVDLLVDGEFVRSPSESVEKGDVIRVKPGESFAVDGKIISGETKIDTSAINGEPVPVSVRAGDEVTSGCINLSGAVTVEASATASESMISKIADAVENAAEKKPKIDRFITRFAKIYTPIVICAAVLTAVIPSIITGNWSKWIYTALTFLVISCPCALVLSVPLAYFSGIGAASKLGILFKSGSSLEALGKVKAIVFDKTGTVTDGTFNVTDIFCAEDIRADDLIRICGSCEQYSDHPAAISIVRYCRENNIGLSDACSVNEISGRGISAELGEKKILCGNQRLMSENGVNLPDNMTPHTGTAVCVSENGKFLGEIIVSDSIKEKSAEAVSQLKKMGIRTAMLTGDKSENAEATGKILGADYVKGELLPQDKLDEIKKLRSMYGPVMFVGDGINDGPVLAGADVGAAMKNGSDLALDAADAIFMNQELDSAVKAKKIADKAMHISYENIIFALTFKALVMILGFFGLANMWFAVFADSGVAMLSVLNSLRILNVRAYTKKQ